MVCDSFPAARNANNFFYMAYFSYAITFRSNLFANIFTISTNKSQHF